jgi:hypothetical protein
MPNLPRHPQLCPRYHGKHANRKFTPAFERLHEASLCGDPYLGLRVVKRVTERLAEWGAFYALDCQCALAGSVHEHLLVEVLRHLILPPKPVNPSGS